MGRERRARGPAPPRRGAVVGVLTASRAVSLCLMGSWLVGCLMGSPIHDAAGEVQGESSTSSVTAGSSKATAAEGSSSGGVECFIPFDTGGVNRKCGVLDDLELCYAEQSMVESPIVSHPSEMRLADLNNDELDDVIVAYGSPYYLQVFWSVPGCGLSEPETLSEVGTVSDADVLDVNADGLLDIFVEAYPGRLLLNEGGQRFSERPVPDFVGQFAASGDLDGDANTDILSFNGSSLGLLLGDGAGEFQLGHTIEISAWAYVSCAGFADFNEDGYADVVAGQVRSIDDFATIAEGLLFLGGPDLTFSEPTKFALDGWFANVVSTGDFDRDGHMDFATSDLVMLGDGTGEFKVQAVPGLTDNIDQVDYDSDGFIDFRSPKELLINRGGQFIGGFDTMGWLGSRAGDLNGDELVDMAGLFVEEDNTTFLTLYVGVPP